LPETLSPTHILSVDPRIMEKEKHEQIIRTLKEQHPQIIVDFHKELGHYNDGHNVHFLKGSIPAAFSVAGDVKDVEAVRGVLEKYEIEVKETLVCRPVYGFTHRSLH